MRRAYILHIVIGGLSFFTFSPLHIFLTIKRPGTITLLKDSIVFQVTYVFLTLHSHTIYIRNNMGQECEGNCGLWVLNEILKKTYPENLIEIMGAVWELPAK